MFMGRPLVGKQAKSIRMGELPGAGNKETQAITRPLGVVWTPTREKILFLAC